MSRIEHLSYFLKIYVPNVEKKVLRNLSRLRRNVYADDQVIRLLQTPRKIYNRPIWLGSCERITNMGFRNKHTKNKILTCWR